MIEVNERLLPFVAGCDVAGEAAPVRLGHGRIAQLLAQARDRDRAQRVGRLDRLRLEDLLGIAHRPLVQHDPLALEAGESALLVDAIGLGLDLLPRHLEVATGLAGGGDHDQLRSPLGELPGPGSMKRHALMSVELVEEGERIGDHAIGGARVGGVDLDLTEDLTALVAAGTAQVDLAIAVEALHPAPMLVGLAELRADDKALHLPVHDPHLIARRGGDRDLSAVREDQAVDTEGSQEGGLAVSLRHHQPADRPAAENV